MFLINNKMKYFVFLFSAFVLVAGCGKKVKKETLWGTYQEPIEAQDMPEDSGARELKQLWKQSVGGGNESGFAILKPYYYQNSIYVASRNGLVYRIDAATGKVLWKTNTKNNIYAAVGVNEGVAVVAYDNGNVVALSVVDGKVIWESAIKRQISAIPAVGKNRVVVRTADGLVIGLHLNTGETVWQVKKTVPGLSVHGDSVPTITGDAVLVGLANGRLIANNVINGRDYWETELSFVRGQNEIERLNDADTSPMVLGTTVYSGTYQGSVVALQLQNAELVWRENISTRLPLAVSSQTIIVVGELGEVVALNSLNGDVLWQQTAFQGHGVSQPIIIGDRVIIGDLNGNIHSLDIQTGGLIESRKKVVSGAIVGIIKADKQFTVFSSKGNLSTLSL